MGIGYQITDESSRILVRVGAQIGQGTNNEAEYQALISGLRHALRLGFWSLTVRSDSLLVVNQFKGLWKAKDPTLRRLRDEAVTLSKLFNSFDIVHTYRENNQEADDLSRQLVFLEVGLPSLEESRTSRYAKVLHEWQAAAVRIWSLKFHPGPGLLGRIFGVATTAIEQIAAGKSYLDADFTTYPWPLEGEWLK
jgi:ribonuclease HI